MEKTVSYQVELVGALSYTAGRYGTFERNKPKVITNASHVEFFKHSPEFIVTELEPPRKAKTAAVTPKAVTRTPSKAPPPVADDADEEDEEDEEEDEEADEEDDEDEADGPAVETYSKSDLEGLTKPALVELGKEFRLKLDANDAKPKLVGEILKAQIAARKA